MNEQLTHLPSLERQIDSLRETGEQFPAAERELTLRPLPGVYMQDGTEALYDARVMGHIANMTVPSERVCEALASVRPNNTSMQADALLDWYLQDPGLLVGFSGYGTAGYNYEITAEGIDTVFQSFRQQRLHIGGVTDGGTGYGVPGLSGTLAASHGHDPIGFAPLRSLRGAAPREDFIVVGEEFGDETEALGTMADVLFVFGGGELSRKELDAALLAGSTAVLMGLQDYRPDAPINQIDKDDRLIAAHANRKLLLCNSLEAIPQIVGRLEPDALRANRGIRHHRLRNLLRPTA
jgi:hypothetical protein